MRRILFIILFIVAALPLIGQSKVSLADQTKPPGSAGQLLCNLSGATAACGCTSDASGTMLCSSYGISGNASGDFWTAQADPAITTVGSLGTATNGLNKFVTDGSTATDCTVGGGTNKNWCQGNGSIWIFKGTATGSQWFSSTASPNGWRYFNGTAIKDILSSETPAGTFPTLNQNTSGTAANLSGTPALPNGTTATTQAANDNSTKVASTAYVDGSNANQVTAGSAAAAAKQPCVASGASKTCTYIDYPDVKIIPAAACSNTTAGAGWNIPASGVTAACRAGTNNLSGSLQMAPSAGTGIAQFEFELAGDWDTATKPYIAIYYGSGANTTGTVIWTVSTACTKQDGSVTDDPSFIAESAMGTQTMAAASRMWAQSAQLAGAMTNCIAGSTMIVKVAATGTASSAINVYKAVITTPRLLTVQAN